MVGRYSWYQTDHISGHLRVTSDDTEFPQVSFKSLQKKILSYFPMINHLQFVTMITITYQEIKEDIRYSLINDTRKW